MKIFKVICFFSLLLLFASCNQIIKKFAGVHDPRPESVESLMKFLKKKGLSQDHVYVFKDSTSFIDHFQYSWTFPKAYVYNQDYLLLDVIEKDTCTKQTWNMVEALSGAGSYPVDSNRTLPQLLKNIERTDGQEPGANTLPLSDFYVVLYWAKFTGKVSIREIKFIEKTLAAKQDSMNIELLKVSCDPLVSWGSEKQ